MKNQAKNPNRRPAENDTDPLFHEMEQFNAEFPTDADCVDALCATSSSNRTCRKGCPNSNWIRVNDRTVQCSECNEKMHLTSGTFFENIRLVREWLFAVWLIDHRIEVNPSRFSKVTGVAYSTAWTMFLKLAMVLTNSVSETQAGDEVPSSRWMKVVTRRSRETEARQSPASEEHNVESREGTGPHAPRLPASEEIWLAETEATRDEGTAQREATTRDAGTMEDEAAAREVGVSGAHLDEVEHRVFQHLSEQPIFIELLREQTGLEFGELMSSLVMLELNGLALRLPGERFVLANRTGGRGVDGVDTGLGRAADAVRGTSPDVLSEKVQQVAAFIIDVFQGVSRKYLQQYVCVFSHLADLVRWPQGAFLAMCVAADAISKDDIRNYVSPPLIKLV